MNYPIGRIIAFKHLTQDQISELHAMEVKRQFIFPYFMVLNLYPLAGLPTGEIKFEESERNRIYAECRHYMPNFKQFEHVDVDTGEPEVFHPSENEIDFMHAWDKKIYHANIQADYVSSI